MRLNVLRNTKYNYMICW